MNRFVELGLAGVLLLAGCGKDPELERSLAPRGQYGRDSVSQVVSDGYYPRISSFSDSKNAVITGGKFTGAWQFKNAKNPVVTGGEFKGFAAFADARDVTIYLPHGTVHSMGIPRSGVVVVGRIEELCSAGYTTTTAKMYLSSYGSDRTRPVPKEVIDQIVRVVPTAELEQKQGEDLQQTLQRLQKDHP